MDTTNPEVEAEEAVETEGQEEVQEEATQSPLSPQTLGLPPGAEVEVMILTPALAEEWLKKNTINRALSQQRVDVYAQEMRAGRWPFTAEAYQFDVDGNMLNGQHRAKAVIASGVSIPVVVARGLPRESMDAMDSGRKRSAANMLGGHAEKNGVMLAAAIRSAIRIGEANTKRRTIPNTEVLAWLEANPEIREAVFLAQQHYRETDLPSKAVFAYCVWRFRQIDPYDAEGFVIDLAKKANLAEDDPILALSRRLVEARRSRQRLREDEQVSLLFRTWNARRTNRPLSRIPGRKADGKIVEVPELV